MNVCFFATQSVELVVPKQPIAIQHYLRQPQRLVNALVDPTRIDQLTAETFRLKMRPLSFMTLSIQPTVDLRVRSQADGGLQLKSIACEIRGVEYINQRFHLDLLGYLAPVQRDEPQKDGQRDGQNDELTYLQGRADLKVQVDLPPPFWVTPKPMMEAAGNKLLRSVLLTIKQRLMHQLLSDYQTWVAQQGQAETALVLRQESNALGDSYQCEAL